MLRRARLGGDGGAAELGGDGGATARVGAAGGAERGGASCERARARVVVEPKVVVELLFGVGERARDRARPVMFVEEEKLLDAELTRALLAREHALLHDDVAHHRVQMPLLQPQPRLRVLLEQALDLLVGQMCFWDLCDACDRMPQPPRAQAAPAVPKPATDLHPKLKHLVHPAVEVLVHVRAEGDGQRVLEVRAGLALPQHQHRLQPGLVRLLLRDCPHALPEHHPQEKCRDPYRVEDDADGGPEAHGVVLVRAAVDCVVNVKQQAVGSVVRAPEGAQRRGADRGEDDEHDDEHRLDEPVNNGHELRVVPMAAMKGNAGEYDVDGGEREEEHDDDRKQGLGHEAREVGDVLEEAAGAGHRDELELQHRGPLHDRHDFGRPVDRQVVQHRPKDLRKPDDDLGRAAGLARVAEAEDQLLDSAADGQRAAREAHGPRMRLASPARRHQRLQREPVPDQDEREPNEREEDVVDERLSERLATTHLASPAFHPIPFLAQRARRAKVPLPAHLGPSHVRPSFTDPRRTPVDRRKTHARLSTSCLERRAAVV
mmetsp:Transcript_22749/g.34626  ORF Transcript_22749/g.34626 Transcript_22749/m.34626 type:complete len:546 (-) Transcript_22749:873-2510(-)